MKYQLSKFREFLKTPFPYLFLLLCIFLASTLLGNLGFRNSFVESSDKAVTKNSEKYELCLVCSGPGAQDQLSDIGFTVANFILFPVTAASTATLNAAASVTSPDAYRPYFVYPVFLSLTALYGILLPFAIASAYEKLDQRMSKQSRHQSIYSR